MPRIPGASLDEIQFRQNDTPPTRAQKLELIRAAIRALQAASHTHDEDDPDAIDISEGVQTYQVPGYFVAEPDPGATLHLHAVTRDIHFYPNFSGSEAAIGVVPSVDFTATIFRNPTMAGVEITGGEIVGTLAFSTDGSVQWETTDTEPVQFLDGDVIGIQAPDPADATAALGAFTLVAWIGFAANLEGLTDESEGSGEFRLLLSGDMQGPTGEDGVWLGGDEGFNDIGSPPESEGTSTLYPTGPQGARGEQGPQGADGADGPSGADGVVQSVVAGTGITVDNTDPANPVVSASASTPWYWDPPAAADFTAASSDANLPVVTDDADVGLLLDLPTPVAINRRYLWKALPAAGAQDWEVIARLGVGFTNASGGLYGLMAVESGTGKNLMWTVHSATREFRADRSATLTANVTNVMLAGIGNSMIPATWFKLAYNFATNTYSWSVSFEGKVWILIATNTIISTTPFTVRADRVGIVHFGSVTNANWKSAIVCDHWTQSW